MKKLIGLFLLLFCFESIRADLIQTTIIDYCAKIQNADSISNITFVYDINFGASLTHNWVIIKSSDCIDQGIYSTLATVYSINTDYLQQKGINNIDFEHDKNSLPLSVQVNDSKNITFPSNSINTIIKSINDFYRVIGFTDTSAIAYLCKRTISYSNGLADSVFIYTPKNSNNANNNLEVRQPTGNKKKIVLIYPNPAQSNLMIYIGDNAMGNVSIELFDMAGHKLNSVHFVKDQFGINETIDISTFPAGIYNVRFSLGNNIAQSRLILKK